MGAAKPRCLACLPDTVCAAPVRACFVDAGQPVQWFGAEVLAASTDAAAPAHTFRIRYDATNITPAEESTVTFTEPGKHQRVAGEMLYERRPVTLRRYLHRNVEALRQR